MPSWRRPARTSTSASRAPGPFPTAAARAPCTRARRETASRAAAFCSSVWRWTTSVPSGFPAASTATSRHPARPPGSTPSTGFGPKGGSRSLRRTLSAKTRAAAASAASFSTRCTSFSIAVRTSFSEGDAARVAQDFRAGGGGHRARSLLERGHEPDLEPGIVRGTGDRDLELVLGLAAAHREVAVRVPRLAQGCHPLLEGEVGLELAVGLRLRGLGRPQPAVLEIGTAHDRAQPGRPRQALDQDLAGALDRRAGVGHALLLVAEGEGPELQGLTLLRRLEAVAAVPDPVGQRLESRLARGEGAVPLLLTVGVVEVLERIEVEGRENPLPQLGGERRVAFDRLHHDGLAGEDLVEQVPRLEGAPHGGPVEVAGALLAVAGDEGHRRPSGGEVEDGPRPGERDAGTAGGEPGIEGGGEGLAHGGRSKGPQCCHHSGSLGKTPVPLLPVPGLRPAWPSLRGGAGGGRANVRA
jgi:hypothetical protein